MKNPSTESKYFSLNSRLTGSAIGTALTTCLLVPTQLQRLSIGSRISRDRRTPSTQRLRGCHH